MNRMVIEPSAATSDSTRLRLARVCLVEGVATIASSLLFLGIFFYTVNRFGWTLKQNFLLSAAQGAVYIVSALSAHPLTSRLGRRGPLAGAFGLAALFLLIATGFNTPAIATTCVLLVTLLTTIGWPILENLVTAGNIKPEEMSRRIAIYNIVWSGVGGMVVALSGMLIEHFPAGLFAMSMLACAAAAVIAWFGKLDPPTDVPPAGVLPAPAPEPRLVQQRVLALWLSRISLPSMYVVTYALAAMLPSLPVMRGLRPSIQTSLGSVWLISRWLAFVALGATSFWHTRPRLLLGAAALMLVSMIVVTIRPCEMLGVADSWTIDLLSMLAGQVALGATMGLIYTASLYFGMVLSQGSTEHGGYHEALIGLGLILGPGAGALTQQVRPGNQHAAVIAVVSLVGLSLLLACITSLRLRRPRG